MKKIFTASNRTTYYWLVFAITFFGGMWYNYTFGDPLDGIKWRGIDIFISAVVGFGFSTAGIVIGLILDFLYTKISKLISPEEEVEKRSLPDLTKK